MDTVLQALVMGIVKSAPFQMRKVPDADPVSTTAGLQDKARPTLQTVDRRP